MLSTGFSDNYLVPPQRGGRVARSAVFRQRRAMQNCLRELVENPVASHQRQSAIISINQR